MHHTHVIRLECVVVNQQRDQRGGTTGAAVGDDVRAIELLECLADQKIRENIKYSLRFFKKNKKFFGEYKIKLYFCVCGSATFLFEVKRIA